MKPKYIKPLKPRRPLDDEADELLTQIFRVLRAVRRSRWKSPEGWPRMRFDGRTPDLGEYGRAILAGNDHGLFVVESHLGGFRVSAPPAPATARRQNRRGAGGGKS